MSLELGEKIFRLYTRGLSYPALLNLAPENVPGLVKEASSEAEFLPGKTPRQKLMIRLQESGLFNFVAYELEASNAVLGGGALAKTRLDLFYQGDLVCAVLLEPLLGKGMDAGCRPAAVSEYHPGAWEIQLEEWDQKLEMR